MEPAHLAAHGAASSRAGAAPRRSPDARAAPCGLETRFCRATLPAPSRRPLTPARRPQVDFERRRADDALADLRRTKAASVALQAACEREEEVRRVRCCPDN